ncbi:MAG: LysE family translocator [Pseudomonadota bacterium]
MPDQFWSLIFFALIATGSPGGATTVVTASGARFGYWQTVPLISGMAVALAILMAISGTSLATTFKAVPSFQLTLKATGSIYLLWLALRIGLAGAPKDSGADRQRPAHFLAGVVLLFVNPKALAMAVGVATTFSDMVANPFILGGLLAIVFALSASLTLTIWSLAGGAISRVLNASWHWHAFNWTMSAVLVTSILQLWV